jgi:hypothetical protein
MRIIPKPLLLKNAMIAGKYWWIASRKFKAGASRQGF